MLVQTRQLVPFSTKLMVDVPDVDVKMQALNGSYNIFMLDLTNRVQ